MTRPRGWRLVFVMLSGVLLVVALVSWFMDALVIFYLCLAGSGILTIVNVLMGSRANLAPWSEPDSPGLEHRDS